MTASDEHNGNANGDINTNNLSRENAINQAIHAVAAGDLELSRMLDAQSERLKYIIGVLPGLSGPGPAIEQALEANESIRATLQTIVQMQMISNQKLSDLLINNNPM